VVFPAPLMTTIAELGSFLAREAAAAGPSGKDQIPVDAGVAAGAVAGPNGRRPRPKP
jgi:hypothetical protein